MLTNNVELVALIISLILCIISATIIKLKIQKSQTKTIWLLVYVCMIILCIGTISQILLTNKLNINPIYFEYFIYIGNVALPLTFFFASLVLINTKVSFTKKYLPLFLIPIITLLLLWTNDYHHLLYEKYSISLNDVVVGPFMNVHLIYTYALFFICIVNLLKYTIKNSGFFSKQSILIILGVSVPVVANVLGYLNVISMTNYITPICFAITILCFSIAIFKFKFISIAPIALQRIVDRISDSYIILDDNYNITDFNQTFLDVFNTKATYLRGKNFFKMMNNSSLDNTFENVLKKFKESNKTFQFEQEIPQISKVFTVEISNIYNKKTFLGILVLFKDITQHKQDIQTIKNNQDLIVEQERLASLGQMIGGIAHNLKTPIFSVTGGLQGLTDLVTEFDMSIDNPTVTNDDMHDIAKDMNNWIEKLKGHISYMSDVITTVKGQAVTLSENESVDFSISELFKRVDILMRHEIKNALATLDVQNNVDDNILLSGNINNLVQIINNIISNALEAYEATSEDKSIELSANLDNSNIIITIKDYGSGIPEKVQEKLFKEMITTKGKNGTGLGLFMSASNIKAHFNGDLSYETEIGKGTTFFISIPIKKEL